MCTKVVRAPGEFAPPFVSISTACSGTCSRMGRLKTRWRSGAGARERPARAFVRGRCRRGQGSRTGVSALLSSVFFPTAAVADGRCTARMPFTGTRVGCCALISLPPFCSFAPNSLCVSCVAQARGVRWILGHGLVWDWPGSKLFSVRLVLVCIDH